MKLINMKLVFPKTRATIKVILIYGALMTSIIVYSCLTLCIAYFYNTIKKVTSSLQIIPQKNFSNPLSDV